MLWGYHLLELRQESSRWNASSGIFDMAIYPVNFCLVIVFPVRIVQIVSCN